MKKKNTFLFIILLMISSSLYAIGFGFHTLKTRVSPEFSKGIFPTSLIYQFDFPIPNMIPGRATEIDFRIDNGLDFRSLKQTPNEGIPYATDPDNPEWNYPKEYLTIFNEMNIVLGQGFMKSPDKDKDLLKLWATIDLRFENSYERIDYYRNPQEFEGLFLLRPFIDSNNPALERFPGSDWTGQPELAGLHSTSNLSMSLGFDINYLNDNITRRNGINYSFWTRLNPKWFNLFQDDSQDYLLIWNKLDLAFTPYYVPMSGSRNTSWFSIVIDNSTTYRFITGSKVPYYVQGGDIFGTKALNTSHVLTNRTSLTFYGPQINSYDCYPSIAAFIDFGVSFGNLLNSKEKISYDDTVASVGCRAEFMIFDIANFYYEIGYVFDNVLNENKTMITRFGFTFEV